MKRDSGKDDSSKGESGNVFFYVLLALALIGLVTMALRSGGMSGANIDKEDLTIRASQLRQQAQEYERAVAYIMQNGRSEADVRFADPALPAAYGDVTVDPGRQVFSADGGGAEYHEPPSGVNDGSGWEFFAHTRIPGAGSDRADLVAVLPNVTKAFCDKINEMAGQTAAPAETGGGCVFDTGKRFGDANLYDDTTTNVLDETAASFSAVPAMQACVDCDPAGAHAYHVYHVLMAR